MRGVMGRGDAYPTPPCAVLALRDALLQGRAEVGGATTRKRFAWGSRTSVLDPACGVGMSLRWLCRDGGGLGIEVRPELAAVAEAEGRTVLVGDALGTTWPEAAVVVVVPPAGLLGAFVARAVAQVRAGRAWSAHVLLPLTAVGSRELSAVPMPDMGLLTWRPRFVPPGRCGAELRARLAWATWTQATVEGNECGLVARWDRPQVEPSMRRAHEQAWVVSQPRVEMGSLEELWEVSDD